MRFTSLRPTPSMVVAMIALAVAIGGTAIAATKIGTKQLKNNAVTTKKIKKKAVATDRIKDKAVTAGKLAANSVATGKIAAGAVKGEKVADGAITGPKIAASAVDGSKVADESIGDSKTSDFKALGLVKVTATDGITLGAAREAAPEQPLFSKGPLEIYAKCYRDSVANSLEGAMFIRTTVDFSILEGDDDFPGGPLTTDYLNVATLEPDRILDIEQVNANDASYNESEAIAAAPDGTAITVLAGTGVKNGAVAADGPYGPGNACVFQASVAG